MKRNHPLRIAIAAVLAGLAGPLAADDTEIYTGNPGGSAPPLVMFHMEYTSNLVSTICTGVTGQDAETLATQCSQMVPLAGYFTTDDLEDTTISSFEMLRAALKKVLAPLGNLKVGFMLSHADNNKCDGPDDGNDCSNGGYILKGFTPLLQPNNFDRDDPDAATLEAMLSADTGKKAFFDTLEALPEPQGNLAHPNQNKEVYFELFRYLTGQGQHNAHNGWADFGTNTDYNLGEAADNTEPNGKISETVPDGTVALQWDAAIESGSNYITPLTDDCVKIFVINILDGGGNAANGSDAEISSSVADGGMGLNVSNGDKGFVEVVRWLHDKDLADGTINGLDLADKQNVTSFFVANQPQQVDDAAAAGGTGYALPITDDPAALLDTLDDILNQILSVSTTFVSASIPVSVFNRSEVLDNVFIALFQANADAQPQWVGNVKKLKLSVVVTTTTADDGTETTSSDLRIIDANGDDAISQTDGRINHDALTFWTDPDGFDVQQADPELNEVAGADGRSVNRGGAGQRIPGFLSDTPSLANGIGTRTLYTDDGGSLIALNADTDTAARLWPELSDNSGGNWDSSLDSPEGLDWTAAASHYWREGVTLQEETLRLLKFIRGMDVNNADGDELTTDGRRWQFGDPLHSRPLPINYGGDESDPEIRLIVGSNDGFLRLLDNTDGTTEDGSEVWAFMPRAVLPVQKRLLDNVAGGSHPYGVDGEPVAYIEDDDNDGTPNKVWLYFGLRRGGRAYYALDITNPDTPHLMWSITENDQRELGLTFSTPQVKRAQWGNTVGPVLIFGGGYDPQKDTLNLRADDTQGNAFYVIDGATGDLVWKAVQGDTISASETIYQHPHLRDGIASKVTAVDTDGDGLVDRAYVGDTGGVLWRADLKGGDRTKWKMTPMLSVGRHFSDTDTEDRRFFHAADVVLSRDEWGPYDGVVIGSGNRAHPLDTTVTDWVYLFKDRNIVSGSADLPDSPLQHTDLGDVTDDCLQTDSCITEPDLSHGWRLRLIDPGEKLLSSPMTLDGVIYFNTYVPVGGTDGITCGPAEGSGYSYAVGLQDARAVFNYDTTNDVTDEEGNTTELFQNDRREDLLSGGIPSDNVYVPFTDPESGGSVTCILAPDFTCKGTGERAAWRTFWYVSE